jgi:hypothetical protein
MKLRSPNNALFPLATAMVTLVFSFDSSQAAEMSASLTAPMVAGEDIANYGPVTGNEKWYVQGGSGAGSAKGQTFTTGNVGVLFKAITYQVDSSKKTEPDKTYALRVGTVAGTVFTEMHAETALQEFTWNGGEYMTWEFEAPVLLEANTTYAVDVAMNGTTSGWQSGIPYINVTGDNYSGGNRYSSGEGNTQGYPVGDAEMHLANSDRVFHIDLEHPMAPSPESEATVPAGDVILSWTNLEGAPGPDVRVDVWFGTDPGALTQVVSGELNTTTTTVNAPGADVYYWRVDTYLDGVYPGNPAEGSVFSFEVIDSDGDGFPDAYELLHTTPPSPIALNVGDDLEPDGLNNWDEYLIGTDPNDADSDDDLLNDGPEVTGVAPRPATDPTDDDTDGDGLLDGVESNTGNWVGASDTGTNPVNPDTDTDGLGDGVETNTNIYVDAGNTGTNPHDINSDNDNATDWYEVAASYTDPNVAGDKPNVPYPLPDPDGSTGATDKPVKVYIMSGQSNMVAFGTVGGSGAGTLETMTTTENKFPNLIDSGGAWTVRYDVKYRGVISALGNGPLTPGFGASGSYLGPELGFGHVLGHYHDEPVLLIKSSIGNRSLSWDCLPQGSGPIEHTDGYTYAGYGQSPQRWLTASGSPSPFVWYAGKQYDDFFVDEEDMGPTMAWAVGTTFPNRCQIRHNGVAYVSKTEHTASAASEPGLGAESSTNWNIYSVFNVTDVLDNFASEYPEYAAQGFEIAGYVWWQGHKDGGEQSSGTAGLTANSYEGNLVNLIDSLRDYYEGRYPSNTVTDAPFVVATVGFGGGAWSVGSSADVIWNAQMAVGDPAQHSKYDGNVSSVDITGYWRDASESPTAAGFHYNHNAETYLLTGDALGRAMIDLLGTTTPSTDYDAWADNYPDADFSNPNADINGNGLTNNQARLWGLAPNDNSAVSPISVPLDAAGTFSYTRRNTELSEAVYEIWTSSDLVNWSKDDGASESVASDTPASEIEIVSVTLSATPVSGKLFVQVRVIE